ncbi:AraC family transcriptional regulator [Rhodobacteraceae bacterium RKSG542]|uniref:helix-turn-helix transcriptional regulator n=1 Tax=Pseudovibrio flavus TaxID=2529854 RepID=UPI0012BC390B|nr:AraC family transcriptional regulator [Pseudovibrio flavus]MTI19312.1 AraC family transcriptional regulator [Pseudovibrio flavus]
MPAPERLDRLSALIEKFRIHAHILSDPESNAGNFFIFEAMEDGPRKLLYLPRADEGSGQGARGWPAQGARPLVAARIEIGGGGLIETALPEIVEVDLQTAPNLSSVAELLVEEVTRPRCGRRAVFDRLCEVVFIRLLRHTIETGASQFGLVAGLGHPRLAHALVKMHESPERHWSLEALADACGMSRTQFTTKFREVLGTTPGAYLTRWRLAIAKMELESGVPLKAVASKVGFSSPTALSRAFRRQFDVSPRMVLAATDK